MHSLTLSDIDLSIHSKTLEGCVACVLGWDYLWLGFTFKKNIVMRVGLTVER